MNSYAIAQICLVAAICIDASLGWMVLLKSPSEPSNQGYFALISSITLWQVATFVSMFVVVTEGQQLISFRLMYAGVMLALLAMLYFVNTFGHNKHNFVMMSFLLGIGVPSIFMTCFTSVVFVSAHERVLATGAAYPYVIFFVCGLIAGVFASIIQRLIVVAQERQRTQLEYMMIGLFVPMLFGVFSTVMVPFLEGGNGFITISDVQVFGAATTVFFSFVMAYAMARHRLMDVRLVLKRKSIALLLTGILTMFIAIVTLFVLRMSIQMNVWDVVAFIAVFGVVTVLIYEGLLKLVKVFLKRGVVDFTVHTLDEQEFMRKIENVEKWARRWAHALQKEFAVERLEAVTYDHRAQCWRQVFPESRAKYALDEDWVRALQTPSIVACEAGKCGDELSAVERVMRERKMSACMVMHDAFRSLGVVMLGAKLDGTAWSKKDVARLKELTKTAERELWVVMQQEHALIMAMEDVIPDDQDMEEAYDEE